MELVKSTNKERNLERNTINQKLPYVKPDKFLYERQGPWPQPSPGHPFGESPAVVHIPLNERLDWYRYIGLRYAKQTYFGWPSAWKKAKETQLTSVSDKEMVDLIESSLFSKFLNPQLDAEDKTTFKKYLTKEKNTQFFKYDLTPMKFISTYPGQFTAPSVTLFKRTQGQALEPVACSISGIIVEPSDKNAWELSKHYIMQGSSNVGTLLIHPLLHFPFDAINAISKTALPKEHILFKLIYPHCRFTLPLEDAVLNGKESILRNWRNQIYGCYPGPSAGLQDQFVTGYKGLIGNSSYPAYQYPLDPPKIYSKYGDFLQAYYDTIYNFVSEVMSEVAPNDPHVWAWLNYIHRWTPGIPDADTMIAKKKVNSLIAIFIWNVSVAHTLDHQSFGSLPMDKISMRLRIPPPCSTNIPEIDYSKIVKTVDTFKFEMAMKMFYRPSTVTFLHDTNYNFTSSKLIAANTKFLQELRMTNERLKNNRIMDLKDISRSIQF